MVALVCWVIALIVAVPLGMFVVECVAALGYRCRPVDESQSVRCSILIPAHDEELGLLPTLEILQAQLEPGDEIVVVADNCSDNTANIAREAGCVVLERFNDQQRGKGYALAHGIEYLRADPPEVVVIVDADCQALPGAIKKLKCAARQYQRPVQSSYLLKAPPEASLPIKISEFAVLVKNEVRCKGATTLGMSVPLLGSGMAFNWPDISTISIASGEIVEDMKLGIELTCLGKGALFLNDARVESRLPSTKEALQSQRERWEHGHMGMIQKFTPPLFKAALQRQSPAIFAFMLDLTVPPLSLLLLCSVAVFVAFTLLGLVLEVGAAAYLVSALVAAVITSVLVIWLALGRSILSPKELLFLPVYVVSKLGLYTGFFKKKQTQWKRTERE
ncbi:glycosyltransferase family 2 protein [Halioxenophilus sp. WMMB6]|uniref:glycosyltransferase family 2 protein n=1 Tax=Halioxenophilus sp. WMMB6 TaxID=3073815 RepID=UPI00295E46B3|nr:glycosyltransferase [Halioxenophilus sp. WMMB6]